MIQHYLSIYKEKIKIDKKKLFLEKAEIDTLDNEKLKILIDSFRLYLKTAQSQAPLLGYQVPSQTKA